MRPISRSRSRQVEPTRITGALPAILQQVMNQPVATRIWRASPTPREAGQGILFTLDPARQAQGAGLSQFGSGPRDGALSVGQAVASHCRIIIPFIRDR